MQSSIYLVYGSGTYMKYNDANLLMVMSTAVNCFCQ
jgi:hypothetical protein